MMKRRRFQNVVFGFDIRAFFDEQSSDIHFICIENGSKSNDCFCLKITIYVITIFGSIMERCKSILISGIYLRAFFDEQSSDIYMTFNENQSKLNDCLWLKVTVYAVTIMGSIVKRRNSFNSFVVMNVCSFFNEKPNHIYFTWILQMDQNQINLPKVRNTEWFVYSHVFTRKIFDVLS